MFGMAAAANVNSTYAAPALQWVSVRGCWDSARSTPMIGDYNADGRDDIIIFYDYGNATSGLWVMRNNGSGFDGPQRVWVTRRGDWDAKRSRPMMGDYNNDGWDDIVIFYDYGNATSAVWTMRNTGEAAPYTFRDGPIRAWRSGTGCWEAWRSTPLIGDFTGDGRKDIVIFYDYRGDTAAVWVMGNQDGTPENGNKWYLDPTRSWNSGRGNWAVSRSKVFIIK